GRKDSRKVGRSEGWRGRHRVPVPLPTFRPSDLPSFRPSVLPSSISLRIVLPRLPERFRRLLPRLLLRLRLPGILPARAGLDRLLGALVPVALDRGLLEVVAVGVCHGVLQRLRIPPGHR